MDEWTPEPLEQGWLVPPSRRPPTAIGVATPPPPRGPLWRHREPRMRRIRRALGQLLVSMSLGLAAGAFIPVPVLLALLFGLAGTRAAWRRRARAAQLPPGGASRDTRRAA